MFGLVMILIVSLFAIFGPMLCPYDYDEADFFSIAQWPSKAHWFGTDALGRDLYVRVLYGARISLSIGVVAALVNMVIGVLYGGIAGYFGGKVDNVMMRIVDIIIALPSLLYTILLMMLMGSNVRSILIALCLSSWVGTARITRSQVVSLKHQEYALAAKLAGASDFQILLRHLLPNAMGPIADQRPVSDVLPHRGHQPDDVLPELHRRRPARRARPEAEEVTLGLCPKPRSGTEFSTPSSPLRGMPRSVAGSLMGIDITCPLCGIQRDINHPSSRFGRQPNVTPNVIP